MKRQSTYQVDQQVQDLFINGYTNEQFKKNESHRKLLACLKEIHQKPQRQGFKWQEKYKHTEDLTPRVYDYDDIFLDFLFDQNIPQFLNRITGFNLMLGDIALRRFYPGISYMSWHRDTHFYNGRQPVGRMPSVFKIIVYPTLGDKSSVQLKVSPGSQHRIFRNKYIDRLQILLTPTASINSSDNQYLFFDSAMLHSVPSNVLQKKPAIRLFYNFCQESQLNQFAEHESLHKRYQQRLNSNNISPAMTMDSTPSTEAVPTR